MTNLNLKFKTVYNDQLYYGQFQYSINFQLQECWVFRYTTDHTDIDQRLKRQQEWRERIRQRWPADQLNRYHSDITDTVRNRVHSMADVIRSIKDPYKIVVENRHMRVYTNDIDLIETISDLDYIHYRKLSQVVVNRPKDTVLLKNPQHCYRSYFKEAKISIDDKQLIKQFLTNQPCIRLGQGLQDWLNDSDVKYSSKYTRDYFFVDYSHESWLTMLALVRPGLIRKTANIIAK